MVAEGLNAHGAIKRAGLHVNTAFGVNGSMDF